MSVENFKAIYQIVVLFQSGSKWQTDIAILESHAASMAAIILKGFRLHTINLIMCLTLIKILSVLTYQL